MKLLVVLGLTALAFAKDDCPEFREMSDQSECIWPRNEAGKMSFKPVMDAFIDKCKIKIDWKGMTPPDIADKMQFDMPEACGKCSYKFKCANREKKDGCFPIKAEKETCAEQNDVCVMPKVPMFDNCRWSAVNSFMQQCVLNRPDLPDWRREGYNQGGRFIPEMNCVPKDEGCACCCHPSRPVKDGDNYVCQDAPGVEAEAACPAFPEKNEWSECLWYPLTEVAVQVKDHCDLEGIVEGIDVGKVIQAAADNAKKDPNRNKMLEKMPKEKCGYCSFRIRCAKRPNSPECFPFQGDKKACGPDDCETCGKPCDMEKVDADMAKAAKIKEKDQTGIVDTCNYHKMVMAYLKSRAGKFMKMMTMKGGAAYWRKRGIFQLMKFVPMGKCKEVDGKCKCCCHPYKVSEDNESCVLEDMCRIPSDMGLEWDTMA